jgi:putative phosphoribosyl transferase
VGLAGTLSVIVDDGIASGATARVACLAAADLGAERVVVAVPVAPPEALAALAAVASEVVCAECPPRRGAVGEWYRDFSQVSDATVIDLLERSRGPRA